MVKENPQRRREILSTIARMNVEVTLYQAGAPYKTERERRRKCLEALVSDIAQAGHEQLCLERDESLVQIDKQNLIEFTRRTGCQDRLSYRHEAPATDPLLAVPDAIAWAWSQGGDWRRRTQDVVVGVVEV